MTESSHTRGILPLMHKMAVVACSPMKSAKLSSGLRALGAETLIFEAIRIRETFEKKALSESLESIADYGWIVFTSAYAVKYFAQHLETAGIARKSITFPRICAIGPETAATLTKLGFRVELIPDVFLAEGVVQALAKHLGSLEALRGQKVLIPRAVRARDIIPATLEAAGAQVNILVCYETTAGKPDTEILSRMRIRVPDLIVFTSSSTAANFVTILGEQDAKKMLLGSRVAALGPVTAQTLASLGKAPEILPKQNTIASLLESIADYFMSHPFSSI